MPYNEKMEQEPELINVKPKAEKRLFSFRGFKAVLFLVVIVAIAASGFLSYGRYFKGRSAAISVKTDQGDIYGQFISEIYDKIQANYWDKISDDDLSNLYKLAAEKIAEKPQNLELKNKDGVKKMVAEATKGMTADQKKDFIAKVSDVILANLKPVGRSRLYTTKQEEALQNNVQNIDPDKNLYAALDLAKGASSQEVDKAYKQKVAELEADKKNPEAKKKIEEASYAYGVLSSSDKKERYDKLGAEPTVFSKLISPRIFYIHITKMSPATLDEFQKAADSVKGKKELNALILDLRDNVGGAVDLLPYFLGPFIGPGQYAFDFFHQGDYTPFKTQTGWLASLLPYKQVVILINGQVQSSAEIITATLKKYNVGVLVGTHTKGWGTIEKVFEIEHQIDPNQKFSALLVHSITLRDDGQPIEGRGVEPLIDITQKGWEGELNKHFNNPELTAAVRGLWAK